MAAMIMPPNPVQYGGAILRYAGIAKKSAAVKKWEVSAISDSHLSSALPTFFRHGISAVASVWYRPNRGRMKLADYIIDHKNVDWPTVLADWTWLLPEELTVWLMNRYGDLFLVFNDGTVHLLEVGEGTITQLAENRDDFALKIDEDDNTYNWLMVPLVDRLIENGRKLHADRCYSFIIPPILGGEYTVENTAILSITEHYSVYASIHQQIKDLPDGTQVVLKIKR
jgi:hypothetical protein